MSLAVLCPTCGHAYKLDESQAGKLLRCKSCGGKITAPALPGIAPAPASAPPTPLILTPPPPAPESVPLNYAPGAVISPQEKRYRRTAIWCGIASALWIIAFALRELLNSVCGIPYQSGEFSFTHTDFSQACFVLFLLGDLLALAASFAQAAAMGRLRRGQSQWIGRMLTFTGVQLGAYLLGFALTLMLLARQLDIVITATIMTALGAPAFIFSLVALASLLLLRRVPAENFDRLVVPRSKNRTTAGYISFGMAALHLAIAGLGVASILLESPPDYGIALALVAGFPAAVGVCYLLCGLWLGRNGYGATVFTLTLAGLEAMLSMLLLLPALDFRGMDGYQLLYVGCLLANLAGITLLLIILFLGLRRTA